MRNCTKIVELYEKQTAPLIDKDEEAQSDSNCALCDTQRNSWQGIVKLPHNQESDC